MSTTTVAVKEFVGPLPRLILRGSEWGCEVEHWCWADDRGGDPLTANPDGSESISGARLQDPKTGRRCCLGVALMHIYGAPPEDLIDQGDPTDLVDQSEFDGEAAPIREYVPEWMRDTHSKTPCGQAMVINDAYGLTPAEKAEQLKPIFAQVGIEVEYRPEEEEAEPK